MSETTTPTETDDKDESRDPTEQMIEQQHENLLAIAQAAGVAPGDMPTSSESKAQAAELLAGDVDRAEKLRKQAADDHAEMFEQNAQLTVEIAYALGVSEHKITGEKFVSDEKRAFLQSLTGRAE